MTSRTERDRSTTILNQWSALEPLVGSDRVDTGWVSVWVAREAYRGVLGSGSVSMHSHEFQAEAFVAVLMDRVGVTG